MLGVDFNVTAEFPADDTGHGFDNIGDVLNISPLLLEKYIAAAKTIVTQVMPAQPRIPMEKRYPGSAFVKGKGGPASEGPLALSYYKAAKETLEFETARAGDYQLILDMTANESYVEDVFDYNKCRFTFKLGDKVLHTKELVRQGGRVYHLEFDEALTAGKHEVTVEIEPLSQGKANPQAGCQSGGGHAAGTDGQRALDSAAELRALFHCRGSPRCKGPGRICRQNSRRPSWPAPIAGPSTRRRWTDLVRLCRAHRRQAGANIRGGHFPGDGRHPFFSALLVQRGMDGAGFDRQVSAP